MNRIVHPGDWVKPQGYSNGVEARGRMVFVAGQVAFDARGVVLAGDIVAQTRQALANIVSVLAAANARPEHVVRMTWYVLALDAYRLERARIGDVYREVMGRHFPAMTLVGVSGLVEPGALLEIEATAVVPDGGG
jgi:enamine deaminase RidA (YjgF/YER057c/UK114 family)